MSRLCLDYAIMTPVDRQSVCEDPLPLLEQKGCSRHLCVYAVTHS